MAFALLILAAVGIGAAALRSMRASSLVEAALFALLAGLVTCAVWVIAAGSYSLQLAFVGIAVAASISFIYLCSSWRRIASVEELAALRLSIKESFGELDALERLACATAVAGLAGSLISAMAPVTNWDAGAAHLALPAAYARAGNISVLEANNYSAYPHLMHALFAMVYGADSESAVGLLSWLFGAMGMGFAICLGSRLANRKAGLIAAAAVAAAPIFADQAGTPSIDLAFATMVVAALTAMIAWRQDGGHAWLLLAALIAGSACGVRHTGYLTVALLVVGVGIAAPIRRLRWAGVFVSVAFVGALPWLLRTGLAVGNPFYPFFASMFGSWGGLDADVASLATHDSMRAWGFESFVRFPWSVVMAPDAFDGWSSNPGVLVLLLGVPGTIFGGRRAIAIAAFCGLGILAMFFFRQHVRYLLPFFLPMMALAGVGAARMPVARRAVTATVCLALFLGIAVQAAAVYYKVPVALGMESRDAYLRQRIERYDAFQWARENVPEDAVILSLDPRGYYFDRDCYQNFEALKALVDADDVVRREWIDERGIDYLFYPRDYVQRSPGFRETGVDTVVNAWRSDRDRFALEATLELDRARGDGTEVVEIYRVRREPGVFAKRTGA